MTAHSFLTFESVFSLCSPAGHKKLASIVGVAVFCQYWFWYPLTHFLSLAFTPTAVIGLNHDLQMPTHWTFLSDAKPAVFAYHPPMPPKKEAEVVKVATAQLSVSAKAAKLAAKKGDEKDAKDAKDAVNAKDAKDAVDAMEVAAPAAGEGESKGKEGEQVCVSRGRRMEGYRCSEQCSSLFCFLICAPCRQFIAFAHELNRRVSACLLLVVFLLLRLLAPAQAAAAAAAEPEPEVLFERLANPSRVTFSQQRVLAVDAAQRYVPLVTALGLRGTGRDGHGKALAGMVMLKDTRPEAGADEFVKQVQPKSTSGTVCDGLCEWKVGGWMWWV